MADPDLGSLTCRQCHRLHDKLQRGFWWLGTVGLGSPGAVGLLDDLNELLRELEGLKPICPGRWAVTDAPGEDAQATLEEQA